MSCNRNAPKHVSVLFALNKLCNQLATELGVLFLQLYGGTVAMAIQGQQEVSEASLCMGHIAMPAAGMMYKVKTQQIPCC